MGHPSWEAPAVTSQSKFFLKMGNYDEIVFIGQYQAKHPTASDVNQCEVVIPADAVMHAKEYRFLGFFLDSGAASSVVGEQQFEHFRRITCQPHHRMKWYNWFRFGQTITDINFRLKIRIPIAADCFLCAYMVVVQLDRP